MSIYCHRTVLPHSLVQFLNTETAVEVVDDLVLPDIDGPVIGDPGANCHQDDIPRLQAKIDLTEAFPLDIVDIEIEAVLPPVIRSRIVCERNVEDILIEVPDQPVAVGGANWSRRSRKS